MQIKKEIQVKDQHYLHKGIPDICHPRRPRRQCKNFKVRGILVFNFTYSMYFCTKCGILHIVCNFTHSVILYKMWNLAHSVIFDTQCVILHTVYYFTHNLNYFAVRQFVSQIYAIF